MKTLKKLTALLVLPAVLLASTPAHSGILLFTGGVGTLASLAHKDSRGAQIAKGVIGSVATLGGITAGFLAFPLLLFPWTMPIGIFLAVLDEKNPELPASQVKEALQQKYSFIDDHAVLNELAAMISKKVAALEVDRELGMLKIERAEILEILAPTDLQENHPQEVEKMIQDLVSAV